MCIVGKCYFYANTQFHGCSCDRCLAAQPQSHRKVAMVMSTKIAHGGERVKDIFLDIMTTVISMFCSEVVSDLNNTNLKYSSQRSRSCLTIAFAPL